MPLRVDNTELDLQYVIHTASCLATQQLGPVYAVGSNWANFRNFTTKVSGNISEIFIF